MSILKALARFVIRTFFLYQILADCTEEEVDKDTHGKCVKYFGHSLLRPRSTQKVRHLGGVFLMTLKL